MTQSRLSILVNDFGGYPFPFQLSTALAGLGLTVNHCYCASLSTTPQASFVVDSAKCGVIPIRLKSPLEKSSLFKRRLQEKEYGRKVSELIKELKPQVVLSANTPLDALQLIDRTIRLYEISSVIWWQDILSVATEKILHRKFGAIGLLIGRYYQRIERSLLSRANHVVMISDAFRKYSTRWNIPASKTTVIPNWAPIGDIPVVDRVNSWSTSRKLNDKFVFMYSGTLALKHNPSILCELASRVAPFNAVVLVRSKGVGAEWLRAQKEARGLDNLLLEPFGDYEETSLAFGSADALVAILESDASEFSVPSKVLAYLCAQRPLLLCMPLDNAAARLVQEADAGLMATHDNHEDFLAKAIRLIQNPDQRNRMAVNARAAAQKLFNIDDICDQFCSVLVNASTHRD